MSETASTCSRGFRRAWSAPRSRFPTLEFESTHDEAAIRRIAAGSAQAGAGN
jgi:hypothetical protein